MTQHKPSALEILADTAHSANHALENTRIAIDNEISLAMYNIGKEYTGLKTPEGRKQAGKRTGVYLLETIAISLGSVAALHALPTAARLSKSAKRELALEAERERAVSITGMSELDMFEYDLEHQWQEEAAWQRHMEQTIIGTPIFVGTLMLAYSQADVVHHPEYLLFPVATNVISGAFEAARAIKKWVQPYKA